MVAIALALAALAAPLATASAPGDAETPMLRRGLKVGFSEAEEAMAPSVVVNGGRRPRRPEGGGDGVRLQKGAVRAAGLARLGKKEQTGRVLALCLRRGRRRAAA